MGGSVRRPIRHGTHAGYTAHRRRNEPACAECLTAHRDYVKATRPSRARNPDPAACPTCGALFHAKGITRHAATCNGRRRAAGWFRPVVATYTPPVPLSLISFACECGAYVDTIDELVHHTISEHRRGPTRDERTPRRRTEAA